MKKAAFLLIAALALAGTVSADPKTFSSNQQKCQNKAPPAPKDLQARPLSPTSVRLNWQAKDNACIDYFEVTYAAEGTPQPRTFSPKQVRDYTVEITGLEPNTRYVFNVRAVNAKNGSSSAAQTRATTPNNQRCSGPPRPPMNVRTRSDSSSTLTVAWEAVANDPCFERFEVTYVLSSQAVNTRTLAPLYVTTNTVTLTGLQANSEYSIVVAAVSKSGERASVTTVGRTLPACPNPPRSPSSPSAQQVGAQAIRLRWTNPAPASCVKGTEVSWADNNGKRGPVTKLASSATEFTFNGLQPGLTYTLSVRYVNPDGSAGAASSTKLLLPNNSQGGVVTVGGR